MRLLGDREFCALVGSASSAPRVSDIVLATRVADGALAWLAHLRCVDAHAMAAGAG